MTRTLALEPRKSKTRSPLERSEKSLYAGKTAYVTERRPPGTMFYVMYCHGFAKVGISSDVKIRLQAVQGACPLPVVLLFSKSMPRKDAMRAEIAVMRALDEFHSAGDWFKCTRGSALLAVERILA